MTNAELIQAIKAEIERRMDKHWEGLPNADSPEDDWTHNELCELGAYKELEHLESFLSTLESEKPMNQDESLNEEIKKEMANLPFFIRGKDQIAFARHFAEWGANHTPLPEDTVLFQKGVEEGKRLMMEEAVEGEVYKFGEVAYVKEHNNTELTKYLSRFNNGDKVKIIVIHETDI